MSDNKAIDLYYEHFGTKVGIGLSEQTVSKIANANSTLFAPVTAWLQGKAAQITVGFLPFYDKLAERKNQNLQNLALDVMRELKNREDEGKPIPDKFEDTDNLLLIQDNASTTSNEEFLKLWAKFYTEEACKPGTISRKTIKLVETLDIDVVKVIENDIFPFCDTNGFYWGNQKNLTNLLVAMDYGIMDNIPIAITPQGINQILVVGISKDYKLYCYPNYQYSPKRKNIMYKLTGPGLEIYENIKFRHTKEQLDIVFKNIELSVSGWDISKESLSKISLKNHVNPKELFVICDSLGNVVYPLNSKYKTLEQFKNQAEQNIEVLDVNK